MKIVVLGGPQWVAGSTLRYYEEAGLCRDSRAGGLSRVRRDSLRVWELFAV